MIPAGGFNFNLNIDNPNDDQYYYENMAAGRTYVNLCPGEIKTIRFKIIFNRNRLDFFLHHSHLYRMILHETACYNNALCS